MSAPAEPCCRRRPSAAVGSEIALAGICVAVLGATVTGALAGGTPAAAPSLCPFRLTTGVPCPFCGLTRSLMALGDGRLTDSVFLHLLGPVVLLAAVVLLPLSLAAVLRAKAIAWPRSLLIVAGAITLVAWPLNLAIGAT
jgi:hypothetical protein